MARIYKDNTAFGDVIVTEGECRNMSFIMVDYGDKVIVKVKSRNEMIDRFRDRESAMNFIDNMSQYHV